MVFLLVVLVAAVAVLSVNLARPAEALGVSAVSASPNTLGATAQISFQVTNQSANTAEEIRVDFLANTFGVPQTIPATAVTVTGETVQSVATTGGTRVTIILVAPGIPQGGTATVTFTPAAGITNPTVPGNYSLSVSTEEEVTPLGSAAFSIVGQIQLLTMTLTPSTAGAMDVTALLTFRVAQNTASGAAVSIGFPAEPNAAAPNEFTVPTTITAAQVQVRAGATAAEAANAQPLSPGGVAVTDGDNLVTVTIILPSGLDQDGTPNLVETGRFIAVRFLPAAGIDSPTSSGTFPLTVSTSVDTAAAQSSLSVGASPLPDQADLVVTKSDTPDPVTLGNNLTYTVNVTNNGPEQATAVVLTDAMFGSFTFVSATASLGSCSGTNPITCSLGNLANGASATVSIVVTPTAVGSISNTAVATSTRPDPNSANNLVTISTTVNLAGGADLQVTKNASPNPVTLGNNLTYTTTVTNNGPAQATGVTLTDTLPGGVTFLSAIPSQGSCSGTSLITCSLGNLANGASATVSIVVTTTAVGALTNTASVTSATTDPNSANNLVTISTTVNLAGRADLQVTKNASPDTVTLGNNLTYTITVTNNGPEAATGVTLTDTLLGSFTLVSATPSQGSCSGTSAITCNLGNLASGASATVSIVVTPTTEGDIINIALVKGAEADSKLVNNLAIERARVKAAKQEDTRSKIEFTGFVQSRPQTGRLGTWKVQGLTVNVDGATEIKGAPQVGSFVKVKGILTAEGLIQAKELKVEKRDEDVRPGGDDHRPGFGLGDRNHKHEGPPGLSGKDRSDKDSKHSIQALRERKDSQSERVKGSDDNHRPGKGSVGKGNGKGKGKGLGD
jgi:uncharacterized repeat protein (TIGR01451 family)